ncbi:unnamed protein product [Allacma fusca]|uniref:Uncharacterized protein n=1 Tax=Allacma fusca TaxID=39272 RepID=A0A8J2JZI2_9HEXA|nr:unnamed protein product [Allacma fusca]
MFANSTGAIVVLALLLAASIGPVSPANILMLCPICPRSHKNVIEPIARQLVSNHTVTMVSSFRTGIDSPNFRDIIVMDGFDYYKNTNSLKVREQGATGAFENDVMTAVLDGCRDTYQNQEFIKLLLQKWDLVVMNAFDNHCLQGFVFKTQAPVIWFMPLPSPGSFSILFGNFLPPSFVPDVFLPFRAI